MKKHNLEDLLTVVEKLRSETYEEIPASLLESILLIEEKFVDTPSERVKLIGREVDSHIQKESK